MSSGSGFCRGALGYRGVQPSVYKKQYEREHREQRHGANAYQHERQIRHRVRIEVRIHGPTGNAPEYYHKNIIRRRERHGRKYKLRFARSAVAEYKVKREHGYGRYEMRQHGRADKAHLGREHGADKHDARHQRRAVEIQKMRYVALSNKRIHAREH